MNRVFNVHGYRFRLVGDAPSPLQALASDFQFFAEPTGADPSETVEVRIQATSPDYSLLPPLRATGYTPRNISYRDGPTTLIDYHGRGLGRHHRTTGYFELTSLDPDLQYEACYLFLLSQLGEALDRRGLHRVHALGVVIAGRAVLVLLPMGGGKSTLGASLLEHPDVQLLSDDSPLIDRAGHLHAFPTRIGLLPGGEAGIPAQYRRSINRMNFGPKTLVDYAYFASRVVADAPPALVCLGTRSLASQPRLVPVSGWTALRRFGSDCVIGMGLFQGLEFVMQKSSRDLLGFGPVAWSRLRASHAVIRRSQVFELQLGRDREANARLLLDYVRQRP